MRKQESGARSQEREVRLCQPCLERGRKTPAYRTVAGTEMCHPCFRGKGEEFWENKRAQSREKQRARWRRYRERHRKRCMAVVNIWRRAHPDRMACLRRAWRRRHLQHVRAYFRAWYQMHSEKVNAQHRARRAARKSGSSALPPASST